jgi:hypothetical protein
MGPVHLVGKTPDGSGKDPGVTDRKNRDEEVEKQALCAPGDGPQHGQDVAQTHQCWCRIVDGAGDGRLILRSWRGPRDLERRRVR